MQKNQAEAVNILHILGKLHLLSEQSQIEPLDRISKNVVDIIKPEEVYELIKWGVIDHKDDVIQM